MPGSRNTCFPTRGAVMVRWAAISLIAGPAAAWAAGADTAPAAVAMTSPATAITVVMTFRFFNAPYSFFCSAHGHIRHAYRPRNRRHGPADAGPLRNTPVWR